MTPQSLGDGKESNLAEDNPTNTPYGKTLQRQSLTKGNLPVPQIQGRQTDKEELKEAGMFHLGGRQLRGGRIILEGHHVEEGSDVCYTAHPSGQRVRN